MTTYGRLTPAQREALAPYVRGRIVHDLGAGTCQLARVLVELGAAHVVAVDVRPPPRVLPPGVSFEQRAFEAVRAAPHVALLSWPSPPMPWFGQGLDYGPDGVMRLVRAAAVVVYLGKNRDGVVCGDRVLFEHFVERDLLAHVPARRNDLLVLGEWHRGCDVRTPTEQEARVLAEVLM